MVVDDFIIVLIRGIPSAAGAPTLLADPLAPGAVVLRPGVNFREHSGRSLLQWCRFWRCIPGKKRFDNS